MTRRLRGCSAAAILLVGLLLITPSCSGDATAGGIDVLTVRGEINPVMADYVKRGLAQANAGHAEAAVIKLDTPGGLDSAMRDIVQAIDGSRVPVIVYVAPSGARAASAGTFITMAGHVAAMAPNTAIGAAHPVGIGGQNIESTLDKKIENDAVAYIRSLAELRSRNADWAEQAVRGSVSVSEGQALQLHVVDDVAPDLGALLHDVSGHTVRLNNGEQATLPGPGAVVHDNPMGGFERFLLALSDPNIAFLLLAVGSVALVIELFHGTLVLGVLGAASLILGLLSLGTLPVNWAGVGLMGLAVLLLAAELIVGSYGALAFAGLLALGAGGLLLTDSGSRDLEVSRWLAIAVPATLGVLFGGITLFALSARHRAVAVGAEQLIGMQGIVRSPIDPEGFISVHGERWQASAPHPIAAGEHVIVTGRKGLHLIVTAAEAHDDGNQPVEAGGPA